MHRNGFSRIYNLRELSYANIYVPVCGPKVINHNHYKHKRLFEVK